MSFQHDSEKPVKTNQIVIVGLTIGLQRKFREVEGHAQQLPAFQSFSAKGTFG